MKLEYPQWQELLAAAILEYNPNRLLDKLQRAEEAVACRMQELDGKENCEHELRLLYDGSTILRELREDRLANVDEVSVPISAINK
jgi:hypothetical protein